MTQGENVAAWKRMLNNSAGKRTRERTPYRDTNERHERPKMVDGGYDEVGVLGHGGNFFNVINVWR